jgi:hypothetical protein
MQNIDQLPASDFKDLLMSLQQLEAPTDELLRQVGSSPTSRKGVQELLEQTRCLERRYADIDTHYGWVLASDRALVARVFGSDVVDAEVGASLWMRRVSKRHRDIKAALRDWISALELLEEESR